MFILIMLWIAVAILAYGILWVLSEEKSPMDRHEVRAYGIFLCLFWLITAPAYIVFSQGKMLGILLLKAKNKGNKNG